MKPSPRPAPSALRLHEPTGSVRKPTLLVRENLGRENRFLRAFSKNLALLGILLSALCPAPSAHADSVAPKAEDNTVASQLKSFKLHPDLEINLFADETMGIANPIAMHWDAKGRLWVLTTLTYAQLEPGQKVDDKLIILEDTDRDGKADTTKIFADGLDMPMGFALGHGGVYVGEGPDLLFLKDTDGDDQADTREVVLTGFGVGDTHQNISNFTWGPDGCLYFAQGLHAYSRVETPWGIVRGETAGFFRFHPKTLKLEPFGFPSKTGQNPCGICFDKTGALFVKSNNREIIFSTPTLIPTTRPKNLVPVATVGITPGKSMGGEYVESSHLPDWLNNSLAIAGYFSHRVTSFPLVEDGSGYKKVDGIELVSSSHRSFRPVEIKTGPDGALYVADWFNPIIGHYQASLRHPDRDVKHGRVWRITTKGRALNSREKFSVPDPEKISAADKNFNAKIENSDSRTRLNAIIGLVNQSNPDLSVILHALDHPRDRFIDYALEQTVHALADKWIPATKSGELKFHKPEHLAFALEKYGGPDAREIALTQLADENLKPETRARFAQVLAKIGSAEDIRDLLTKREHADDGILRGLIESWPTRKVRAAPPFLPALKKLVADENESIRAAAVELAGLWDAKPLAADIGKIAHDKSASPVLRGQALLASARIEDDAAIKKLTEIANDADSHFYLRLVAVEGLTLTPNGTETAATAAVNYWNTDSPADDFSLLLKPFLNRKNGSAQLAKILTNTQNFPKTVAETLALEMQRIGRRDRELMAALNSARGVKTGAPEYSVERVAEIAKAVETKGDAEAGKAIFHRAELTCAACHQIKNEGGILGPSLDTVGAGLPLDLLVESVLWPDRQMKEGYFTLSLTTKEGKIFTGYQDRDEGGVIFLRDTASGKIQPVPKNEIAERKNVGSLMPAGLTNRLSENELRDLIAYLVSLKG